MVKGMGNWTAACGLDCESCELRRLTFDSAAADKAVKWYREQGWLGADEGVKEAVEKKMYCCGCHGSRDCHWSADCWILKCCVDDKGLRICSDCDVFPCDRLVEWSLKNSSYEAAFHRLEELRSRGGE